jgi:nicotinate phosphoribosyltransferase
VEGDVQDGAPLIREVMASGRRIAPTPTLDEIRAHTTSELHHLPAPLRRLQTAASYTVTIAASLEKLADETDRRLAGVLEAPT